MTLLEFEAKIDTILTTIGTSDSDRKNSLEKISLEIRQANWNCTDTEYAQKLAARAERLASFF